LLYAILSRNNSLFPVTSYTKVLILISLIIIFFLPVHSEGSSKEKQIIVVFRYDDYSSLSSTELEIRLITAFQNFKIPCTFGVVPFTVSNHLNTSPQTVLPLSETKSILLKNAMIDGTLEIAQHGYSHQTISLGKMYSEFYGIDYDSQLQKIGKGKKYLEDILHAEIDTFIPPFNTYDLNTIRALEKLGFSCISSSLDGDATEFSKIRFLPATCSLLQLQNAVKTARNIRDPQPIIVVLFHEYDFLEIDKKRGTFTYQEFLDVLNWLTSQKDIHVMTVKQANKMAIDLSAKRLLTNHSTKSLLRFFPPFLRNSGLNNSGLYFSSGDSLEIRAKNWIRISLCYSILLISTAVFFCIGFVVFSRFCYMIAISKYGSLVLLIFSLGYALHKTTISYKTAMSTTAILGMFIGVWSSFFIFRMRNRKHGASNLKPKK